ncbi:MAG: hypothetical protein QOF60_3441 [Actinomycetota bacterium]|jgi:hypothetical protein|nr:hypothetical protein [Actinomycetota bacterium]
MILDSLAVDAGAFATRTGWAIKPEGACRGEVCVPLPSEVRNADGSLDVGVLAQRLGMPLLHDNANSLWALGPSTVTGKALTTAEAPSVTLPDLDGDPFDLATLRGQKVLLVAWASW